MLLSGAKAHVIVTLLWLDGVTTVLAYIAVVSLFLSCRRIELYMRLQNRLAGLSRQLSNACQYFVSFGADTI